MRNTCKNKRCVNSCTSDDNCSKGVCNTDKGKCVMCNVDGDCADNRRGNTCENNKCVTPCASDNECSWGVCNTDTSRCVKCNVDGDCKGGKTCNNNRCVKSSPSMTTVGEESATQPSAQGYQCGSDISDDCQSEYKNALNNGNLETFYERCKTEGGDSPLRARCSLCCEEDETKATTAPPSTDPTGETTVL